MNHPLSRRTALQGAVASAASLALPSSFAAGGDEVLIGQSVHLSGPFAASLVRVLKGQALAIDEFNHKAGPTGRKVRLITLDDTYDPKRCVENLDLGGYKVNYGPQNHHGSKYVDMSVVGPGGRYIM